MRELAQFALGTETMDPVGTSEDFAADLAAMREGQKLLKTLGLTDSEVNNCLVTP